MTRVVRSTGDVFRDLGFSEAESSILRLRSDLLDQLQARIAGLGISQAKVAALLGVTQPRVSNIMSGRVDLFSLDALAGFLERLGCDITITVSSPKPSTTSGAAGRVATSRISERRPGAQPRQPARQRPGGRSRAR